MAAGGRPASTRSPGRGRLDRFGAGEILLTSMDRDGTKSGFDIALTRAVADAVRVPVIASGGVGTLDHLVEGIRDGHATAVLAASIFHFGTYRIAEAKARLAACGIPVRLLSDGCRAGACRSTGSGRRSNRAAAPIRKAPIRRGCSPAAAPRSRKSSARKRSRRSSRG